LFISIELVIMSAKPVVKTSFMPPAMQEFAIYTAQVFKFILYPHNKNQNTILSFYFGYLKEDDSNLFSRCLHWNFLHPHMLIICRESIISVFILPLRWNWHLSIKLRMPLRNIPQNRRLLQPLKVNLNNNFHLREFPSCNYIKYH